MNTLYRLLDRVWPQEAVEEIPSRETFMKVCNNSDLTFVVRISFGAHVAERRLLGRERLKLEDFFSASVLQKSASDYKVVVIHDNKVIKSHEHVPESVYIALLDPPRATIYLEGDALEKSRRETRKALKHRIKNLPAATSEQITYITMLQKLNTCCNPSQLFHSYKKEILDRMTAEEYCSACREMHDFVDLNIHSILSDEISPNIL